MLNRGLYLLIRFDSSKKASISFSVVKKSMSAILAISFCVFQSVPSLGRPFPAFEKYERTRFLKLLAFPMYIILPSLSFIRYTPGSAGTSFGSLNFIMILRVPFWEQIDDISRFNLSVVFGEPSAWSLNIQPCNYAYLLQVPVEFQLLLLFPHPRLRRGPNQLSNQRLQ